MDRPRVLIAEDRPSVLELIATILERGYDVTRAIDGATALSLIEAERFEAVLTDIRMPGASGFEVLRAVRRRAPATSVVMITAYANVTDAVAAIKLGAYDYLAKPLDSDEISLIVARAVAWTQETQGAAHEAPTEPGAGAAAEDVPGVSAGYRCAVEAARDRASRRYLVELMRLFRGNVTQAAIRAGMTRESLHRVLKKYEVRSGQHRDEVEVADLPQADPERRSLHAVK
jgi:DNA-binding NtrC family response regulator